MRLLRLGESRIFVIYFETGFLSGGVGLQKGDTLLILLLLLLLVVWVDVCAYTSYLHSLMVNG